MKRIQNYIFLFCLLSGGVFWAQNQPNITISTALPNLATDTYTRATSSIKLQPGFKYGHVSGGATYLLNLSIGNTPSWINSNVNAGYLGSGLNSSSIPNCCGYVLDQGKPVAETKGSFAVSATGSAVYVIPVFASPGTSKMQPQLSIFYDSQSEFGMLGKNWDIGGLSRIRRTNKTVLQDGHSGGIELSFNDAFSLDGNRLHLLSGGSGQNGSTYYQEDEEFSSIVANGSSGSGPQHFIVKTQNGATYEYGNTPDSRLTAQGDNTVLTWYLNKVTDEFGNYMLYKYKVLSGEVLIDKIEYTGNTSANLLPYNEITFDYIDIVDKQKSYINGKEYQFSKVLKSISCYAESLIVRRYGFDYKWDQSTLLSKITEAGSDGIEANPFIVHWKSAGPNFGDIAKPLFPTDVQFDYLSKSVPVDFTGDGLEDNFCFFDIPAPTMGDSYFKILLNDGIAAPTSGYIENGTFPYTVNHKEKFINAVVTDEDLNDKQELYVITALGSAINPFNNQPNTGTDNKYYIDKISYNSVGNYNITRNNFTTLSNYNFNDPNRPPLVLFNVRDYTGDGENDQLRIDPEKIVLTGSQINLNYNFTALGQYALPFQFDSDAESEYIIFSTSLTSNTIKIMNVDLSTGQLSLVYSQTIPYTTNSMQQDMLNKFDVGDFNGDNISDICFITDDRTKLFVLYGKGNGFTTPIELTAFTALAQNDRCYVNVIDLNQDGKDDISVNIGGSKSYYNSSYNSSYYFTYLSVGSGFVKAGSYYNDRNNTNEHVEADTNGDDLQDYGLTVSAHIPKSNPFKEQLIKQMSGLKHNLVEKLITGHGNTIDISYFKLAEEYSHKSSSGTNEREFRSYYKKSTVNYNGSDLYIFKPNIICVSNTTESNFQSTFKKNTKYTYTDAIIHKKGRGFLGFESVNTYELPERVSSGTFDYPVYDWQANIRQYNFLNNYKLPILQSEIKGQFIRNQQDDYFLALHGLGSNGKKFLKKTYQYNLVPRYSKGYYKDLVTVDEKDYVHSTETITQLSTNMTHGKLVGRVVTTGWESNVLATENYAYTYTMINGIYKPQAETFTRSQAGVSGTYSRSKDFTYDAMGHLTSIVNDPSAGNNALTTSFGNFNFFGDFQSKTISAPNITNPRSETLQYDAKGRYIVKRTDALNNTEELFREPKFGSIVEHKNISGFSTFSDYDAWGKLVKMIAPDGVTKTITYAFEQPLAYPHPAGSSGTGLYSVLTQQQGQAYVKEYYDAGGQLLRTETEGFQGQTIVSDSKYNYLYGANQLRSGLILEKSEPHTLIQNVFLKQEFEYELETFKVSKIKTVVVNPTSPAQTIYTQVSYSNRSNDGNYQKYKVTETNQSGIQKITEYNTALQKDIVKNNRQGINQTAQYTFHPSGQPSQMSVSGGINPVLLKYVYDVLGRQTQLIDPSAGTIYYDYNALGELTQQTSPGTGPTSNIYTYSYDLLGRLTSKTGSGSGVTNYVYETGTNGKGQLKQVVAPGGITSSYVYDYMGRLTQKMDSKGAKQFISGFSYDQYGRVATYTYPNGLSLQYTYDNRGELNTIKNAQNQMIWQLSNEDAIGRITDFVLGNGLSVQKQFDDYHFLKMNQLVGLQKQTYDFDPLTGNLKNRRFENLYNGTDLKEKFTFDGAERLTKTEQIDPQTTAVLQSNMLNYSTIGNITHKDDAGDYVYGNATKPFQLTKLENSAGNTSLLTLALTYNDLRKPAQIQESNSNKEMVWTYGTDEERIQMDYKVNGINHYSRFYSNNYDLQESGSGYKSWAYIYAPSGLCAVWYDNNGSTQMLYTQTDHLGSPVLLTSANANPSVLEENSFDSWGRRRNTTNWTYSGVTASNYLIRGYTMHEELPEFKLVNMNARLYDAVLGRFIQPDNEIQDPDNLQNINRYSYVLNNPLKYFDPSGNEYEAWGNLGYMDLNPWEQDEGQNGYNSYDQSEGYDFNANLLDEIDIITFKDKSLDELYEALDIEIIITDKVKERTAITLPGIGIYISSKITGRTLEQVKQHEVGHYLLSEFYSFPSATGSSKLDFYSGDGILSLLNALTGIGGPHSDFFTEVSANKMAEIYFGSHYIYDEKNFPLHYK